MAETSLLKQQAQIYLKIAYRQLEMAEALFEQGFYEGVVFHCYHAFEAACSAGVASKAEQVSFRHRTKFNQFRRLYPDIPFANEFASLLAELYPQRERALYADVEYDQVTDPTLAYDAGDARQLLTRTKAILIQIAEMLD